LAALLARRGFDVEVFEKRPDMRRTDVDAGRSINLVLTRRGLRALEVLGLREAVLEMTVPVLGRMMHSTDRELAYTPYGKDDSECNYSVSRGDLNAFLLDAAADSGARLHFDRELVEADLESGELVVEDTETGERTRRQVDVVFGADGAPSAVRRALMKLPGFFERTDMLEHGYKELLFPAAADGEFPMAGHALHIWPRGDHMLMGLANPNGSFTGTIYLRHEGPDSFAEIDTPDEVDAFFHAHYADAIGLLEDFQEEFLRHPLGQLGTVRCHPWHLEGKALLVGDAAHGIVPFFGQGLNCGFEDCAILDELLARYDEMRTVFAVFDTRRKPDAEAIADMALENFVEMRDLVADPRFVLRKLVETRIEQTFPELYRSRYAMVMYSTIPYRVAYEVGAVQEELLGELLEGVREPEDVDMDRAQTLIATKLTPIHDRYQVDLTF